VTEGEISVLLDAHDALIRACVESRLEFEEFVAAYGSFPAALDEDARSAIGRRLLELFGKRIAFHKRVASVISGPRGEVDSPGMNGEAERLMPMVGLIRLRALVERYPDFKARGGQVFGVGATKTGRTS
jgi:hypothetical protein